MHTNHSREAITHRLIDGYDVHFRKDESGCLDILSRIESGALLPEKRFKDAAHCSVALVRSGDARYIVKYHLLHQRRLEDSFRRRMLGQVYSRIMRETDKAIRNGCDFIQDVFLVAEKKERKAVHSIMLCEYVEGTPLNTLAEMEPLKPRIRDLIRKLHSYGIAFGDPNPTNIILTPSGRLKFIDISCRNSFLVAKAKDVIMMREFYNMAMPVSGLVDSAMVALVGINRFIRKKHSRFKKVFFPPLRDEAP